jgi:hypothetical protein
VQQVRVMKVKVVLLCGRCAAALAVLLPGPWGCTREMFLNQTKELTGDITLVFNNTTSADAGFSFGTWNELDRNPPGAINFQQSTVPAFTISDPVTIACARNTAVATQPLVDRVLATKADVTDTFIPEIFDSVVHFTVADSSSSAAGLPTAGTANGLELLLGVHYSCADEIIFTFVEDHDAPGGFRVDYEVILDTRQNQ